MDRRLTLKWLLGLSAVPMTTEAKDPARPQLRKSKAEWASLLPLPAFRVLFEEATERPGTSPLNAEKHDGRFVCAA